MQHVALNVAIVWPGLASAGPTLLIYIALRCCYRLAGALERAGSRYCFCTLAFKNSN